MFKNCSNPVRVLTFGASDLLKFVGHFLVLVIVCRSVNIDFALELFHHAADKGGYESTTDVGDHYFVLLAQKLQDGVWRQTARLVLRMSKREIGNR